VGSSLLIIGITVHGGEGIYAVPHSLSYGKNGIQKAFYYSGILGPMGFTALNAVTRLDRPESQAPRRGLISLPYRE
jgi:hypothetical protein